MSDKATHTVAQGKLRYNAYLDGPTARDIATGRVLAVQAKDGKWSKPVKPINYKHGQYDHVVSLGNTPVTMTFNLPHGRFH